MIPVDGAGWNAGDWFDAPSDVPCVFVVSVFPTWEYFVNMVTSPL